MLVFTKKKLHFLFQVISNYNFCYKQNYMSKSQQQFVHQKALLATIHNRTKSNRFRDEPSDKSFLDKAKQYYHAHKLVDALQLFKKAQKQNQQPNHEISYFIGLIHLALGDYKSSQKYLEEVGNNKQNYKGNVYMLLAICNNKMKNLEKAQQYINLQCEADESIQSFFYRGKIKMKGYQYSSAIEDFRKVLFLDSENIKAKIFLLESLGKNGDTQECLKQSEKLINQGTKDKQLLNKINSLRLSCLVDEGKIEEAKGLIEEIEHFPDLDYWKSKIAAHEGKKNEQILLLNECLSSHNKKTTITKALSNLIVLYMKEKDFYEAFHYSNRSKFLKIQSQLIKGLAKQAEGMTFLMKKKFTQAITLIGSISLKEYDEIKDSSRYLKNLYNNSMGYGHFSLGDHKTALSTYRKIQIDPQNLAQTQVYLYNICLCEGILASEEGKIEQSIKFFQQSTQHLLRAQPYFYISVILIRKNIKEGGTSDIFMKVLNIIDAGLKVGENCQMYYYRGLIYLYLGMNVEAIDDVDKAIEKSEDNVAKYFYLRGLIFVHERNYEQAISQFTTCLSIDEKFYDAFLERAKAKLLFSEIESAFEDLDMFPLGQEWKAVFHLYQGNYDIVIQTAKEENTLQIAYFQLKKYDKAGPAGKIIEAILYKNYSEVMELLNEALNINFPIGCLDIDDLLILKAYCNFCLGNYADCLQNLNKSEEIVNKSQNHLNYEDDEKKLLLIKINIIFGTLLNNELSKALELCQILINDVYEGPIYDELLKLHHFLTSLSQQSEEKISYLFNLFQSTPMISDSLPHQSFKGLKFKFFILFPRVKVHEIQIPQSEQPLLDFGIQDIENRPEAPWMRKDENGVIFTNQIQQFDELNLQTEENEGEKTSKEKIKESLQLDADIVNKLQKLSKK